MGIGINDQIYVCRQLSALMTSGLTLYESLSTLSDEAHSKKLALFFVESRDRVMRGESFGALIEDGGWKSIAIALARVGETSGSLANALHEAADELARSSDVRKKALGALIYPACIALFAGCLIVGIVTFIFPKIVPILKSVQGELPLSTRTVMFVAESVSTYGLVAVVLLTAGVVLLFVSLKKFKSARRFFQTIVLHVPIVGRLYRAYILAQLFKSLGILTASGVTVVDALEITTEITTNVVYTEALSIIAEKTTHGSHISDSLLGFPKLFPKFCANLILVGERTGSFSGVCEDISKTYSRQFQSGIDSVSKLIEPALMISLGCVVGFIAISIISPIYEITSHVKK